MKKTRTTLGLIFALTLGASAAANGAVLYNNIPNLNAVSFIDPDTGQPITIKDDINSNSSGKALSLGGDYVASLFATPTCASNCSPLTLGNITLVMSGSADSGFNPLASGAIKVEVYSNAATFLGGDPNLSADDIHDTLGSSLTTLTPNFAFVSDTADNNVFTSALALDYNTKYWVKLSATGGSFPAGSGDSATWFDLATSNHNFLQPGQIVGQPPASFVFCPQCGNNLPAHINFSTDPQLLMKVEATTIAAVPVPGAAWLMGSALLGLMRPWRRKGGH